MKYLILLFVSPLTAATSNPWLEGKIYFSRPPAMEDSFRASIQWTSKTCEASWTAGDPKSFKKLAPKTCDELKKLIAEKWPAIEKVKHYSVLERQEQISTHLKAAELEIASKKMGVLFTPAKVCKADLKDCHFISDEPHDQVGFKVIEILNSVLAK